MACNPAIVAYLTIGQQNTRGDKIGPGYELKPENTPHIMRAVCESTRPLTVRNAAFCIDDRPIVQLGENADPDALKDLTAPRLPGGTFLAATKAAVEANAVVVRHTKDFDEAYDIVASVLSAAGCQDAGHEGCGAENNLVASVEYQVDPDTAFKTLQIAGIAVNDELEAFEIMYVTKQARLKAGFYASYSPDSHQKRVFETASHNFARLQTSHDSVHGHHASGLYLPPDGMGLSNGFTQDSGVMFFAYTHSFAKQLAHILGHDEEERHMIELGFAYDFLDVSNTLIASPEGEAGQPGYYPGLAVIRDKDASPSVAP